MAKRSLHLKLFRREAVERSRQRWLGAVLVATPPGAPFVAAAAGLTCLLLGFSTVAIQMPERVLASGVIMPSGRILQVLAPRTGTVTGISVSDGMRVERGQRLLDVIVSGDSGPDSPTAARRRSLERELLGLDEEAAADAATTSHSVRSIERRIELAEQRLQAVSTDIRLHQEQLEVAARQLERGRDLLAKGSIAAHQVDELTVGHLSRRTQQHAAYDRRLALEEELALLRMDRDERHAAAGQRRLRAGRDRERLRRELLALGEETMSSVTAPAPGSAGAVLVSEGSAVHSGQLLLQLFEPDSELLAYLYISADDNGRVRRGQAVELRLHAYPYQLYGTLAATIIDVASVPVPAASLTFVPDMRGAVYELRARLDHDRFAAEWARLGTGARFSADLVSARWPLYRWLLRGGRPAG